MGEDKSDLSENLRASCEGLLPDAESKRRTWEIITDVDSKESIYKRGARMGGFYSWKQKELVEPYFDEFFKVLPTIYEKC